MLRLIQSVAICGVSWLLWKIFRCFVVKTPIDNIPGPVGNWWIGVLPKVFNVNGWAFHDELNLKYGRIVKLKAALGENQLYVSDPLALHHIVVKDQYTYEETSGFIDLNNLMFGPGLLSTLGDIHKRQRKLLNPVFSTAHMRNMIPIFFEITKRLRDTLSSRVKDGPTEIELLNWMTRTALELIGQSGLGTSFDPLVEDEPAHPFTRAIKRLMPAQLKIMIARNYLLPLTLKIGTSSFRRFVIDYIPWKALHEIRDVVNVMHQTSLDIHHSKNEALLQGDAAISQQIAQGKDIISVLLRANLEASDDGKLSETELIGQVATLCFAATDTTSSALSRILTLLSTHQDVQDELRKEIRATLANKSELSYDEINDMKYMDAICRETLRLYPPIPTVQRTARKDIVLPLGTPVRGLDGSDVTEIPVPKGTNIIISIIGCNRDPALWGDDSYEWKPERWLQPLPETITSAHIPGVYSNVMTFLGGGRACIGFKFSQLEMKVVLCVLLNTFKFSQSKGKEIVWRMNTIASPSVLDDPRPQLPLVVELAK